jgi:hypothetical protein
MRLRGPALAAALTVVTVDRPRAHEVEPPSPVPEGAEEAPAAPRLDEVLVLGRQDSLLGLAESASQGVVGREQLSRRPVLRPGELEETVPGVIVTQHSGSGKANQFFLRGFNLDHGTDFATYVGGVPINLPTHGHGQGYTDLNFVIPELVETIRYRKGPYYADAGDFSSAGEVRIDYARSLDQAVARVEGGSFGYLRGVLANSTPAFGGDFLYAVELLHDDGPWSHPDDFQKLNAVLRQSGGDRRNGWSLTALAYSGDWDSTDQIAERAVEQGLIRRFGSLDETDGGESQRYGLTAEAHKLLGDGQLQLLAWSYYYDLDLFSNFTYFLSDPVNGDQFQQKDERVASGASADYEWSGTFWWGRDVTNRAGMTFRADVIDNGLFPTLRRQRLGTVRADEVVEASFGPYFQHETRWLEKLRTVLGIRGDVFLFDVESENSVNSGNDHDFLPSPKLAVVLGPWLETEFYGNAGLGFHSNDGRGVTTRVDPATGIRVSRADALVRTEGAEVGLRTLLVQGLQSTVSLWLLESDSELVFVGDAGTTEASRPSRRYGVEWANYYDLTRWLAIDADLSVSNARFTDSDLAGRHIPGSIETAVAAGVSLHDLPCLPGLSAALRLRYFGPRPLLEDESVRSAPTALLSARVAYEFVKNWTISLEAFNLLDEEDNDIEYFYTSRLPGEAAAGVDDRHFHPVYPFTVHISLTARF